MVSTLSELSPGLQLLEALHLIELTVLDDMRLLINPSEIARADEHNSATFVIAAQPASLDGYVCRAEVETSAGKTHRLVVDGKFSLTSDIAVQGMNRLQLVYSDGSDIVRKTYAAAFHVSQSVNAIDESDPEFQDGLGQITRAAFASAIGDDTGIQFYNIASQPLDFVAYPPGQGGGLDEATANLLYVRQDGTTGMTGDLRMVSSQGVDAPIDIVLGGRQATIGWDIAGTLMRRGQAGEPVSIANNDGSLRSPIITELIGDQRYLREINANDLYLAKSGGQMGGPLITAPGGSTTNPGLGIGDNATGFFRAGTTLLLTVGGQLYAQWLGTPPSLMMTVPLNMATQAITNVPTPNATTDAANRAYVDAAVAAVPRPTIPAARTYIPNEVTIGTTDQVFFDQPFFTADNNPRTILITIQPEFDGGTPSQFSDLIYTTNLSVGLQSRITVYGTAAGYMHGTACFAATVTPASLQIQVSLSVRQNQAGTTALIQVGSRTNLRTYVTIQEMTQ